ARTLLAQVEDRLAAGRLDHYHQILDATEHDVRETAAALLALAAGDEGPAPRSAQPRDDSPRRRREERFSDSGDFVGASFEEGRAAGPRRSRPAHSGTRAPGARSRRHEAATRYRVEVGHR